MGHMVGKDVYRRLGRKIDNLTTRAPWDDKLRAILTELYTSEEADLVVKMPYGVATLAQVERVTGYERRRLEQLLAGLAAKGLVMDFGPAGHEHYIISPLVVGIFEFTMMRTRGELKMKEWARLFHSYLQQPDTFYKANCGQGQQVGPLRAVPHDDTIDTDEFVEVLDYEKATAIVENARRFAIGVCSCRHEKLHMDEKECDVPLETCTSFDAAADDVIQHGFGREVSRTEMLENFARSREMRLALCADNVRKHVSFVCHCCGCCCNLLLGVTRFGYANTVVTSNYIATVDEDECNECGACADACPVDAISLPVEGGARVDESICLGCGVCVLDCTTDTLKLKRREQKVLHPEDTFERVILQSLERGTLQNILFANPQSRSHGFMRGFVGGFLKLPPVKQSLMSDTLRSRFLDTLRQRS